MDGVVVRARGLRKVYHGADDIEALIQIEDGRARGTAKTTKSGESFGKKYDFDISFDASVLALPTTTK